MQIEIPGLLEWNFFFKSAAEFTSKITLEHNLVNIIETLSTGMLKRVVYVNEYNEDLKDSYSTHFKLG